MQGPAITAARELGFFTVAVDGSSRAVHAGSADSFEQIDLKDREGLEAFARRLQSSPGGLGGIMTAGTDFSASVAWTAQRLGLPGIPYETALNASDKGRMRRLFREAGLPSPDFSIVSADDDPESFPLPAGFPLVVKPVDNMGGRGCRRVDCRAEFAEATAEAVAFSRSGRAIVEAYMEGPEFSVDAIVYKGEITICGLADRHIFFPPFFIEMGHTMPTAFPKEQQREVLETFTAAVRALGIADGDNVGAAKGDIKLTAKGAMIGEIAARLSGGYMSGWTYPYSSGVNPARAAVLAAMGRKPDMLSPAKTWTSAERAFISIPGTVMSVNGTQAAGKIPGVQDLFLRIQNGAKVGFPENNVSKCGNTVSAAPDRETAIAAAESAARAVLIRLDPADGETGEFLEGVAGTAGAKKVQGFPPDAFALNRELLDLLEAMPETQKAKGKSPRLLAFPALESSSLKDWAGRSVPESLEAVRNLTELSLTETGGMSDNVGDETLLGRSFWAALVKGTYQGAAYYIDRLMPAD